MFHFSLAVAGAGPRCERAAGWNDGRRATRVCRASRQSERKPSGEGSNLPKSLLQAARELSVFENMPNTYNSSSLREASHFKMLRLQRLSPI